MIKSEGDANLERSSRVPEAGDPPPELYPQGDPMSNHDEVKRYSLPWWAKEGTELLDYKFRQCLPRVFVSDVDYRALEARLRETEQHRCETCGATISDYPNGCPTCGAPQCCPMCCKVDYLKAHLRAVGQERDEWKRRAEVAEADNIRARDLIAAYGVPRQRAESVSRAVDVLVARMGKQRDNLRRQLAQMRVFLASLHVKLALPLNDDVADRKAMMAEIDDAIAALTERDREIANLREELAQCGGFDSVADLEDYMAYRESTEQGGNDERRDGVTMRQRVGTDAPAGIQLVDAADYDEPVTILQRADEALSMAADLDDKTLTNSERQWIIGQIESVHQDITHVLARYKDVT